MAIRATIHSLARHRWIRNQQPQSIRSIATRNQSSADDTNKTAKLELINSIISKIKRLEYQPSGPQHSQQLKTHHSDVSSLDNGVNYCKTQNDNSDLASADDKSAPIDGRYDKIAFEVDDKKSFFVQSSRYLPFAKLKHRLLFRLRFYTFHIPYFELMKMANSLLREIYLTKLFDRKFVQFGQESEWLDPDDEKDFVHRSVEQKLKIKQQMQMK